MSTQAIPAVTSSGQPILILKEGAAQTRGKDAQRNNIMAAKLIAEIVRTSLGPRGMDKMLVDSLGDVTITSDGATVLKEIDIQHPSAKMMVEIAKTTDNEVGDGTTSAVVLAGALLERAEELIDKDVHPTVIVDGYRKAAEQALKVLEKIAVKIPPDQKDWLLKIAKTSMETKMVSRESGILAEIAASALLQVAEKSDEVYKVDIDDVKVEKKAGASLAETKLIKGLVIDKEVVHAGMPKRIKNAKIALINAPLEIEKTEFDAKININNPEQIKLFLDEENRMLKTMVDRIAEVGANLLICQKGIDDIAQHYLAKAGIIAVRRAKQSDMDKLAKATGGRVVTNLEDLSASDLGFAELVEERKIEEDKWVFIEGCKNPKAVTILVRGGTQRIVDEAERSIHDALCVTRDVMQKPAIVAGGGAPEAHMAHELREWSHTLSGREQLAAQKFAEALEVIPLTLAENAGLDTIDTQVELRAKHGQGMVWAGVGVFDGGVVDTYEKGVFEPLAVKEQIIKSATEAACMIIRIDDVIAAGKVRETGARPGRPGEEMPGAGED
ncbi:MAG: TCP-1/cpn60 chaperonin family protein [archaeon]|nr:TCP-1/cpn60 chaperonin family protein [archaeon]MCP8317889.1 TCP-1/cpn60 chaperonin family protein [archaeon]MCP8320125.1 TCP-1/cpn60 chaperonin family protein [archaeon]